MEFWKNLTSHFPTRTSHYVGNQRNCLRLPAGEGPGLVGWVGYMPVDKGVPCLVTKWISKEQRDI